MARSHFFLCMNCALPRGGCINDWSGKAAPWKPTARPELLEAEATSGISEAERTSKALCVDLTEASGQSCNCLSSWCPESGKTKKIPCGGMGSNACCPAPPPNGQRRGAERFPPPSPDPSQDLREGGSVRGKPIGTNFGLSMTINDPPACTGSWAPQGKPKTLSKLGGADDVKIKPKFVPMSLLRVPPPSRRARQGNYAFKSNEI